MSMTPQHSGQDAGARRSGGKGQKTESKEYSDPKADVRLESADLVVFRVHKYHLMSASTVFRTMLEDFPTTSDGSDAIGLSDVEIESSAVVKASLDLLYGLPCPDLRLNSSGDTVRNMLKFLHKYECSTLLDHLRLHIRQSAHEGVQMRFTLLEAAIVIDDPKLCRNIILGIADRTWNAAFMPPNADSNAQRSDSWIPGGHVLDVSAMSEPTRRRIPERYLTALLRAYRLANGKRTDWAMVADEFYWQVTGRRESRDAMCRMELRNSGGRAK